MAPPRRGVTIGQTMRRHRFRHAGPNAGETASGLLRRSRSSRADDQGISPKRNSTPRSRAAQEADLNEPRRVEKGEAGVRASSGCRAFGCVASGCAIPACCPSCSGIVAEMGLKPLGEPTWPASRARRRHRHVAAQRVAF